MGLLWWPHLCTPKKTSKSYCGGFLHCATDKGGDLWMHLRVFSSACDWRGYLKRLISHMLKKASCFCWRKAPWCNTWHVNTPVHLDPGTWLCFFDVLKSFVCYIEVHSKFAIDFNINITRKKRKNVKYVKRLIEWTRICTH